MAVRPKCYTPICLTEGAGQCKRLQTKVFILLQKPGYHIIVFSWKQGASGVEQDPTQLNIFGNVEQNIPLNDR